MLNKVSYARFIALSTVVCFVISALPVCAKHASQSVAAATTNLKDGQKRFADKDYDGAVDSYLQAIYFSRNKYFPDAYLGLARSYKEKHQDAKAIEAYKTYITQATVTVPEAHVELGMIYMRNNRDDEANTEFNAGIVESTTQKARAPALNALGLLTQKRGDYSVAEQFFLNSLGEKPWRYTEGWMNYSENLMKLQKWVPAIGNFNEMLQQAHNLKGLDESKVYVDLGVCMMTRGNHQGALEDWRNAIAIAPESALPHLLLGQMFDKENHISSAITEYRAYLKLAPKNDKDAQQVKDRLMELEQKLAPREREQPYEPVPQNDALPNRDVSPPVNPESGF